MTFDFHFTYHSVDFGDLEVSGHGFFTKGRMYESNGDPGYPDEGELSYEVLADNGDDVTDELDKRDIDYIEEKAWQYQYREW